MITIHFNFTNGTELSYAEGLEKVDGFTTNCISFFDTQTKADDVRIIDKEGNSLYLSVLLSNDKDHKYGNMREVTKNHNLQKMFKAGVFDWRKLTQ